MPILANTSPYLFNSDSALTTLHENSFSVAFWLRPGPGATYTPATLLLSPAWFVGLNSDGTLTFTIQNSVIPDESNVTTTGAVVGSDWNFIVLIYNKDDAFLTIYLNGVADTASYTNEADSSLSEYTDSFQLGTSSLQDTEDAAAFDLDSVSAYARVLTDFEAGVLYNNDVGLDYPFMGGPFSLIFQASLINDPPTPLVLGSGFQLWFAARSYDGDTATFTATMELLFSGNPSSRGFSWSADNFFDKVVFAQHDNVCQYWIPPIPNLARPLPGLPSGDAQWDGLTVFFGHVLLWKEDRLKWSDKDDFTLWIPVDQTIVSATLTVNEDFVQPAPGGIVTVTVSDPVAEVVSVSLSGDMDFGSLAVGSSDDSILTITNTGTVPLNVTGLALPSGFSGNFVGIIPVNGSVPVVITFAPQSAIDYTGAVTVASNATFGTTSLPVSGTGTGTTKVIALSGVLDFGKLLINRTLQSSLIIENTGNTTLTVTSITLPSGFTGSFAGTVAAGAKHIVAITFSPTAVVTYGGSVSVASDATAGSGSILITGSGVTKLTDSIFLTDNGSLQFGSVPVGTTPTGTLRIYNPGSDSIKVVGLAFPGGYTGAFTGTIAAHGSHDVTVTFSPVDGVFYGGVVTVATQQATKNGNTQLNVSGTGTVSGKVIKLTGTLDFGGVLVNSFVQGILKISNIGTVALTVTSITYPTGFSGAFAGTIAPGASKNVLVTFAPVSAITYSGTLTVNSDKTSGTETLAVSGTGVDIPVPTGLETGQFVGIIDEQGGLAYYNYYTVVSMTGSSVVLQLLDLTGASPSGSIITLGHQIVSVDANESGETRAVGSQINGPIFRVMPQGDYAYIFKERSIQAIQYTGLGNGTFFIHPEVSGEGMLGRNAICNLNDGRIAFLGHKELYVYNGGSQPQPVCQQTIRQLYRELDRTKLHQVILFNNEQGNELWVQYPVVGGFRVMIWNYVEDTASFDDYDPALVFSALGLVDWSADPTWAQLSEATSWESFDPSITWDDLIGASQDHLAAFASEDGNLRLWGTRYAREGMGYLSLSESMDFDLGDGDVWKYVDVVKLGLQVRTPEDTERLLYVQVGCRPDLTDADIVWSDPQSVLVNGHADIPVKVNPGGSGRYIRLRLYSQDADVQWRVSSYEIICRQGGSY